MKIIVLLAGVLDPKWPVAAGGTRLPDRPADRLVFSPFDEAALEIALKIRDAQPETTIRVVVSGGEAATKLARAVCALNVADVATIALSAPWNQGVLSRELAGLCGDFDLILVGREFGDCDDGLVPPMLAGLLGRAYFGRVQAVETTGSVQLLRESGEFEERLGLEQRLVASVTNDRRTRLRKPLMKNVMMARQASIGIIEPIVAQDEGIELVAIQALAGTRTPVRCTMIEGSPKRQAEQLAALLLEAQP